MYMWTRDAPSNRSTSVTVKIIRKCTQFCDTVKDCLAIRSLHLRQLLTKTTQYKDWLINHFIHCQRWIECKHTCTCTSMILHRHYDYMLPEAITCCCFSQHFTFNMWSTSCKKKKQHYHGEREWERDRGMERGKECKKKEGKVDGGGRKERLRELQRTKEENKLWTAIFMMKWIESLHRKLL